MLRKRYFCTSEILSILNPIANKTMPAISQPVPKAGWMKWVTLGEFRMVTGSEHVQTQNIWLGRNQREGT